MLKHIGFLLIMLAVAGAGYLWFTDYLAIGGCVDGGGAWDYAKKACRYS